MAIKTDIYTINWDASPRVIWIDISETEGVIQDLYDTCKYYESQPEGMDDAVLCDAGGKEPLGGSVNNGLTVSLFNAVYAFADRPGPDWVICNMAGGNIVAFTDATRTTQLYPRKATAYVSADRTSSSSATLQDQESIEYASYGGVISIDVTSDNVGTDSPMGNLQYPLNNIDDAHTIGEKKGLPKFSIIGNLNLINPLPVMVRHDFIGQGKERTTISIHSDSVVTDASYYNATMIGQMDGKLRMVNCVLDGVQGVNGYVENCILAFNDITLGGGTEVHFIDCNSGKAGVLTPKIIAGSGIAIGMRGYKGGVWITQKTGPESISIDLLSGQVKLDSTVVNGTIVLRGKGKLTDADTGEPIYSGNYHGATIVNDLTDELVRETHQAHYYRRHHDKVAHKIYIYDTDNLTVLHEFDETDDLADITPV